MARPRREIRPAKRIKVEVPENFNHWLQIKHSLLKSLKDKKGVFMLSKKFYLTLTAHENSGDFEEERRAYGLAPPLVLKPLDTDSEESVKIKKDLYTCLMGGCCSTLTNREKVTSYVPPVMVALGPEDDWKALNKLGIHRHEVGYQFLCLSHLRTPDQVNNPKAKSAPILRHWLTRREIWPGALIYIPAQSTRLDIVKTHIREQERSWFNLLGHSQGQSTLPLDEDLERLP